MAHGRALPRPDECGRHSGGRGNCGGRRAGRAAALCRGESSWVPPVVAPTDRRRRRRIPAQRTAVRTEQGGPLPICSRPRSTDVEFALKWCLPIRRWRSGHDWRRMRSTCRHHARSPSRRVASTNQLGRDVRYAPCAVRALRISPGAAQPRRSPCWRTGDTGRRAPVAAAGAAGAALGAAIRGPVPPANELKRRGRDLNLRS